MAYLKLTVYKLLSRQSLSVECTFLNSAVFKKVNLGESHPHHKCLTFTNKEAMNHYYIAASSTHQSSHHHNDSHRHTFLSTFNGAIHNHYFSQLCSHRRNEIPLVQFKLLCFLSLQSLSRIAVSHEQETNTHLQICQQRCADEEAKE